VSCNVSIPIKKIYVDGRVIDEPLTKRILENTPGIQHQIIDVEEFEEHIAHRLTPSQGKRILFITGQKGDLVKPCPGTLAPYLCCRYSVINQIMQCPMDCTYCVLQEYLDNPVMILHTDMDDVFDDIDCLVENQPGRFFRFGTGELSDSLVLDAVTELTQDYARFFSSKRNTLIEFKTKTSRIDTLLNVSPKNIVVSWSVNPQPIIDTDEFFSARLDERLDAARRCQDRGFLLGFHFDPILHTPDWEALYHSLIQQLFSHVDGSRIAWVSLGSLRYPPRLKEIALKRFPRSRIFYEEMIRGMDGKMRYPKPMRVEMYRKIYGWLMEKAPDLFVYFCMESPDVWDRVTGTHPASNAELDFWFARNLYRRFPELDMDSPNRASYTAC